jgi:hypothetical protein
VLGWRLVRCDEFSRDDDATVFDVVEDFNVETITNRWGQALAN